MLGRVFLFRYILDLLGYLAKRVDCALCPVVLKQVVTARDVRTFAVHLAIFTFTVIFVPFF